MAVTGRKPKPQGQSVNRVKSQIDWREIPNVPFEGGPDLPEGGWTAFAREWWKAISTMPHCVLWERSDWVFAIETAMLADLFANSPKEHAAELRARSRTLGTTDEARRDMRIRYVDPSPTGDVPENVTPISDYRDL